MSVPGPGLGRHSQFPVRALANSSNTVSSGIDRRDRSTSHSSNSVPLFSHELFVRPSARFESHDDALDTPAVDSALDKQGPFLRGCAPCFVPEASRRERLRADLLGLFEYTESLVERCQDFEPSSSSNSQFLPAECGDSAAVLPPTQMRERSETVAEESCDIDNVSIHVDDNELPEGLAVRNTFVGRARPVLGMKRFASAPGRLCDDCQPAIPIALIEFAESLAACAVEDVQTSNAHDNADDDFVVVVAAKGQSFYPSRKCVGDVANSSGQCWADLVDEGNFAIIEIPQDECLCSNFDAEPNGLQPPNAFPVSRPLQPCGNDGRKYTGNDRRKYNNAKKYVSRLLVERQLVVTDDTFRNLVTAGLSPELPRNFYESVLSGAEYDCLENIDIDLNLSISRNIAQLTEAWENHRSGTRHDGA